MGASHRSNDEMQIVFGGATVNDLAQMFDLSRKEVNERLTGKVLPVTESNKVARYRVREAAPYLCNVAVDVESLMKTMKPSDLPNALQLNFWRGQGARQDFEEKRGDLWRTARVVQIFSDVFKTLRMQVLMFGDNLEQVSELTPVQRLKLQELGDSFLAGAHKTLVEQFKDYVPPPDEHGRQVREGEVIEAMENNAKEYDDGFGDD